MIHLFIGHDTREEVAYDVCRFSAVRRSSDAVKVTALKHKTLRQAGLFNRPWLIEGETGRLVDCRDHKPMSTEFAFTRFLTPHLARQDGAEWAVFCDCDFLFLADIATLVKPVIGSGYAVMVVKHRYEPPEGVKMDGQVQQSYPRKNWSSLMVFNVNHPACRALTPEVVNAQPGAWLHGLQWASDDAIGALPAAWNVLVGHTRCDAPKAVHFTEGGPWMEGYEAVPYARDWIAELAAMRSPSVINDAVRRRMAG